MRRIQIKPDVVMNSSKLLPLSSVANIQDDLTRVRTRLDHRIRSRHNIDGRLNKVIREIDDIERKMHKIKKFTQQSMERYTQVERQLANHSSRLNRQLNPGLMKSGNWWEGYFSSDKKTRNRLINLLFPWLQLTFQRHFGLLYPIGPALSFNKWINPNSPREVSFSDVENQAIVDYLKKVENGEVPSNMDQYAGMTNSYEGYIGENNIFGQPLGGNAPKNVETVATILDFLPFIGNLKAASEAYLGYDPLTGRKLEDWERGVAAAAILGGGAARLGGKVVPKVVDKVGDVGKGTDKFEGTLRGENVILKDVRTQEIVYNKRAPEDTAQLRREFNNIRKNYLKDMVNDPKLVDQLREAGLSEANIALMKNGRVPVGWQVHHKLPLDDGGTNSYNNLILIKNEPYHKVITNTQMNETRGLKPGESKTIQWPIPDGFVYPTKPK